MGAADKLTLHRKYKVSSADADMYKRLRPGAMINFIIQAAIDSADELGFGFADIETRQLFWVLSRMTVEIYKTPVWYDEVSVETWPKDSEGLLYFRDLILRDKNGEIIANATTAWLAIDFKTIRPKILQGYGEDYFRELKHKKALDYRPARLGTVKGKQVSERLATFFDLDLNQHVTSTRYIDWIFDTFDNDFQRENYPRLIEINYLKETKLGQGVAVFRKNEENTFLFEGIHTDTKRSSFRAKITF